MDDHDEVISLSKKYRTIMITGITRVFITRFSSIIYIYLLVRFVPLNIQDQMVIINSLLGISATISLFGLSYSLTQRSIMKNYTDNLFYSIIHITILIGIPLNLIAVIIFNLIIDLSINELVLLSIVTIIHFIVYLSYIINDSLLKTELTVISKTIYSVLNSIFVPSLFLIFDNFMSILFAWLIALFISLHPSKSTLKNIFIRKPLNFDEYYQLIKFGFPVYITTLLVYVSQRLDIFILYLFYDTGQISQYYWVMRIAQASQELFFIVFTGLFPIFTKLIAKGTKIIFYEKLNSFLRILMVLGTIFFGTFIINTKFLLYFLLNFESNYYNLIIKIAFISYFISVFSQTLTTSALAQGQSSTISIASILGSTSRTILLILLYSYGAVVFVIILLVQKVIISFYYYYVSKNDLHLNYSFIKIIMFSIISISISFLTPTTISFINSILISIMYLFLNLFLLYLIKPINNYDYNSIKSIINIKKLPGQAFFKRHFINN